MLDLKKLSAEADRVLNFAKLISDTFDTIPYEDCLKIAIMASLTDAERTGFRKANEIKGK
jgi:hypothetical protein